MGDAPAGLRMLFSTTANDGHFGPLAVLAAAAVRAGHDVRVAAPMSYRAAVEGRGFVHAPFDDAPPDLVGPVMAGLPAMSFEEANATVVRDVFGRIDAQAAFPALAVGIDEWRPHIVVREPAELGALAAAVRAGIPHVQVAIGMTEVLRFFARMTASPLVDLAVLAGLPESTLTDVVTREPVFSPVPNSLDQAGDPDLGAGSVALRFRDDSPVTRTTSAPALRPDDRPLVYVTFGSVTGSLTPFTGSFRHALEGLADLPVRVFMTVGRRVDVDSLGLLPGNATVVPWWPQAEVFAGASVVLGHGGFGTTMGAILAGLPQVVAPLFSSDQLVNAQHVAAVGAGRGLAPGTDVIARACAEVPGVLADPAYRSAAARVAAEAVTLPTAQDAVRAIAALA